MQKIQRMRTIMRRWLPLILISSGFIMTGCSHIAGNVIPEEGPTMESIYDDWGDDHAPMNVSTPVFRGDSVSSVSADPLATVPRSGLPISVESPDFSLLDNPPLKLYILPHLAGSEGLPIPGYWTVFSAYPRNVYALPLAIHPGSQ